MIVLSQPRLQALSRRPRGAERRLAHHRARRDGVRHRPFRRGQDHVAQADGRDRAADRRARCSSTARTSARCATRAVPFLRRNFGLIFQDHKLLFDRTVFDNVVLPLSIGATTGSDAARRVRAALDKVGLLGKEKAIRSRSRAANSSGCASRAPSSTGPRSCSPTSRPATSTPVMRRDRRALSLVQPGRRHRRHRDPRPAACRAPEPARDRA